MPIRIGVNAGSLDPRLLAEVRQGHRRGAGRVGAVGVLAVRGARLPRHQDLGQAQRPGGDDPGLPAARRAVRLPAAPGRHRGRPGVPGHDQVGGRVRRAAGRGHRRHHPGLAVGAAGRGGQGRQRDPGVARACASAAWRSSPARPAAGPRSTSTRWPSRSPPALEGFPVPLRVAVMGCVVNGPGEAREADLGVASGNGKGQIFVKGEVIKTVPGVADRGDPDRGGAADRRRDGRRAARGAARPGPGRHRSPCTDAATHRRKGGRPHGDGRPFRRCGRAAHSDSARIA